MCLFKRSIKNYLHQKYCCAILAVAVTLTACTDTSVEKSVTDDTSRQDTTTGTNRLSQEKSPYLLQHANNPIDWYPWGAEAFEKAKTENKPIFLSIGYSTCHWCHVMARESFEDPEIAAFLNEHFVNVKVDREERPDVDALYMSFVQKLTGSGGWPMSVWLTPDRRPFDGGTYFPPRDTEDRVGFITVLQEIQKAWETQQEAILTQSEQNINALRRFSSTTQKKSHDSLEDNLFRKAYVTIAGRFDPEYTGFSTGAKFPRPVLFNFLLRFYAYDTVANDKERQIALDMSLTTLRKMASSGLHDPVGGGFHRYCVDRAWRVPHFEKMLYDQAQLALAYLDAYQITQDDFYADIARKTLDYVHYTLRDEKGGFYSAEDAQSLPDFDATEKVEGAFYLWTASEIDALLDETQSTFFNAYYGILPEGNVPLLFGEAFEGQNVLAQEISIADLSAQFNQPEATIRSSIAESYSILFENRQQRPRPHRDDKIITAWNGLMLSAFACAYSVLDDSKYLDTAIDAATFIQEQLYDPKTNTLLRSYRNGPSTISGFANDYAYLIQGLLDLYEASFDTQWLEWAIKLQTTQDTLFADTENGGYYNTTEDDTTIPIRLKEKYDSVQPSANAVATLNLMRLFHTTGNTVFQEQANSVLNAFASDLEERPFTMPQMLVALQYSMKKPQQIILAGDRKDPLTQEMARVINRSFSPYKVVLLVEEPGVWKSIAPSLEILKSLERIDGKTTAYVCENYVCQLPTNEIEALSELLSKKIHAEDGTIYKNK